MAQLVGFASSINNPKLSFCDVIPFQSQQPKNYRTRQQCGKSVQQREIYVLVTGCTTGLPDTITSKPVVSNSVYVQTCSSSIFFKRWTIPLSMSFSSMLMLTEFSLPRNAYLTSVANKQRQQQRTTGILGECEPVTCLVSWGCGLSELVRTSCMKV